MKKQLVKHLLHSAAALMLCATLLTGIPIIGTPAPGGNDNGDKPGINVDLPRDDGKGDEGDEPGISPMNDLPPDHDKRC